MEEDKYCLVITEWSLEDIKERYKNIKSIDSVIDIGEYVEKYFNSLNAFITSNNLLISDIKKQNLYFNDSFISIRENAIGVINNILKIVKPFREYFKEIVGDGSIFQILNCGFLKRDFNKLFEELYVEFGSAFRSTSDLLLTICVFEFIMIILMLFIVASLKKNKGENIYNLSGSLIDEQKGEKETELN